VLTLLHTADVHVATFEALLRRFAPRLRRHHIVAADLLAQAEREGLSTALRERLRKRLAEVTPTAPTLVLCTCSTLGGLAEDLGPETGLEILRLDRALAEAALDAGRRILVLAAVGATLGPTREMLESVARSRHLAVNIDLRLVENAWGYFCEGDLDGYRKAIADAARRFASDCDVIVLAQASMASAADLLSDLPVPVLTSPALGIKRALARIGETPH
jgi:hypothetical protein